MSNLIKSIFTGNDRRISLGVTDLDLPDECMYLNSIRLDHANKIIPELTQVVNGEWWCDEYEWSSNVAYVTSQKAHSEIELFDKIYYNIDTQKLLDWLICRQDSLYFLQQKKVMIELLKVAFNNIVSNPQKYPMIGIYVHHTIEGRHTYIHEDIQITIQFLVEENEYNLTFNEFLAQIPQLVDDGNPNWEYR